MSWIKEKIKNQTKIEIALKDIIRTRKEKEITPEYEAFWMSNNFQIR